MAKHKQARRAKAIAMAMAASLAMGTITAFADTVTNPDGSTTTTSSTPIEESGSGTKEDPTTSGKVTATITMYTDNTSQEKNETEENSSWEENKEGEKTTFEETKKFNLIQHFCNYVIFYKKYPVQLILHGIE